MIHAPVGHYWEVHLGRFETTVVLMRDTRFPTKVGSDSFGAGAFTDKAMLEAAVERTANRILTRFTNATLLSKALGVKVLVK